MRACSNSGQVQANYDKNWFDTLIYRERWRCHSSNFTVERENLRIVCRINLFSIKELWCRTKIIKIITKGRRASKNFSMSLKKCISAEKYKKIKKQTPRFVLYIKRKIENYSYSSVLSRKQLIFLSAAWAQKWWLSLDTVNVWQILAHSLPLFYSFKNALTFYRFSIFHVHDVTEHNCYMIII